MADEQKPIPAAAQRAAKLEGKLSRDEEGRITQDGYGLWPTCGICREQVEPTEYAAHSNAHILREPAKP